MSASSWKKARSNSKSPPTMLSSRSSIQCCQYDFFMAHTLYMPHTFVALAWLELVVNNLCDNLENNNMRGSSVSPKCSREYENDNSLEVDSLLIIVAQFQCCRNIYGSTQHHFLQNVALVELHKYTSTQTRYRAKTAQKDVPEIHAGSNSLDAHAE